MLRVYNFTQDTLRLALVDVGSGGVESAVEIAGAFVAPRAALEYGGELPGGARVVPSLPVLWPGFVVQGGGRYYLARRGHSVRLLEYPEVVIDPRVD